MRTALLLLLLGCSEPYGICAEGNVAEPGPGCSAVPLAATLDGDSSEWAQHAEIATCWSAKPMRDQPHCIAGYVRALQFAREPDAVVFHLATEGPPAFDAQYHVELYQFWDLERLDSIDVGLLPSSFQVRLNDHLLSGYAIEQARGPAGIEVRVPLVALPFVDRANVRAYAIYGESGHVQPPAPPSSICWDGSDVMACRLD